MVNCLYIDTGGYQGALVGNSNTGGHQQAPGIRTRHQVFLLGTIGQKATPVLSGQWSPVGTTRHPNQAPMWSLGLQYLPNRPPKRQSLLLCIQNPPQVPAFTCHLPLVSLNQGYNFALGLSSPVLRMESRFTDLSSPYIEFLATNSPREMR